MKTQTIINVLIGVAIALVWVLLYVLIAYLEKP
jgi:hypothetical protein